MSLIPESHCAVVAVAILVLSISGGGHAASETLTNEPTEDAYNFVAHYRTVIDASPAEVWPILVDLPSWMFEFELSSISGEPGAAGQVLRLYQGQDFLVQVAAVVPEKLLSMVNLPVIDPLYDTPDAPQ